MDSTVWSAIVAGVATLLAAVIATDALRHGRARNRIRHDLETMALLDGQSKARKALEEHVERRIQALVERENKKRDWTNFFGKLILFAFFGYVSGTMADANKWWAGGFAVVAYICLGSAVSHLRKK